jgi:hypothetical protein
LDVFSDLQTTDGDPGPSGAGDAGSVRADLVGNSVGILNAKSYQTFTNPTYGQPASGNYYFNPANFSTARANTQDNIASMDASQLTYYTYGSLPRNAFRGPGAVNLDIALAKKFRIRETASLELRVDAFNAFNHTNFSNPDTTITDATFGQISNTAAPRILQVAAHLRF